jgi:hypothetical protein
MLRLEIARLESKRLQVEEEKTKVAVMSLRKGIKGKNIKDSEISTDEFPLGPLQMLSFAR